MMVDISDIEEFARHLVAEVRDRAIRSLDRQFAGGSSVVARRLVHAREIGVDELASQIIADSVDEAIGYLLVAIDQQTLPLSYRTSDGGNADLWDSADGLSGEYMGSDGWRSRFSSERIFED
jgi:hypothetical protein